MDLVVKPPILPMLAKRVDSLPPEAAGSEPGGEWIFEPKWDGFRTLVFRDGDEILLQSREGKPMNRYFPELLPVLAAALPQKCVLDGELVVAEAGRLEFESLQMRVHPAASRVAMLSRQIPASMVFFDLLCVGEEDMRPVPFRERRARLEAILAGAERPLHLTPATRERAVAADWFRRFEGAGLDGIIAKRAAGAYEADKRVMLKIKHERDCDCVVAGFRWHKGGEGTAVGSLLLGLYDDAGALQHVGVAASFTAETRRALVELLASYRTDALADHPWRQWAEAEAEAGAGGQRRPGAQSRWSQGKDLSWQALRPELVVQVAYEHMQGTRFRHLAHFRRWRPDKAPRDCTYAQLEVVPPEELSAIFR